MKKIKIAIALSKEYFAPKGVMRDMPLGRFLLNEFPFNSRVDTKFHFHSIHDEVDVQEFFGYDAVVNTYILRQRSALHIDRFDKFKGVKCCVSLEPHNTGQKWFDAYHKDEYSFCWYHYPVECIDRRCKLFNTNVDYRRIVPGINRNIYKSMTTFKNRIKDKILLTGSLGVLEKNYYVLRKLCAKHPDVKLFPRWKFFGSQYPILLQKYRSSIAASTEYTVMKYIESAACGCLVFMEGTELNAWESLGFINGFSAVRIDQDNYKLKLREFLETADDPKWEIIANRGRKFAFETFDTNIQANLLIDHIEEYL